MLGVTCDIFRLINGDLHFMRDAQSREVTVHHADVRYRPPILDCCFVDRALVKLDLVVLYLEGLVRVALNQCVGVILQPIPGQRR